MANKPIPIPITPKFYSLIKRGWAEQYVGQCVINSKKELDPDFVKRYARGQNNFDLTKVEGFLSAIQVFGFVRIEDGKLNPERVKEIFSIFSNDVLSEIRNSGNEFVSPSIIYYSMVEYFLVNRVLKLFMEDDHLNGLNSVQVTYNSKLQTFRIIGNSVLSLLGKESIYANTEDVETIVPGFNKNACITIFENLLTLCKGIQTTLESGKGRTGNKVIHLEAMIGDRLLIEYFHEVSNRRILEQMDDIGSIMIGFQSKIKNEV